MSNAGRNNEETTMANFGTGVGGDGTKQTMKRVAASVIADQLGVTLEGYWAEQYDEVDPKWCEEVRNEMQKILNPVFDRLERITKGFHCTDIDPTRRGA